MCLFGSGHPSRGLYLASRGLSSFEEIQNIPGVIEARRANRVVNGEESICSVLLFLDMESLSTQVQLSYINYRVRAFIPRPMQCDLCKAVGHVANVYRR